MHLENSIIPIRTRTINEIIDTSLYVFVNYFMLFLPFCFIYSVIICGIVLITRSTFPYPFIFPFLIYFIIRIVEGGVIVIIGNLIFEDEIKIKLIKNIDWKTWKSYLLNIFTETIIVIGCALPGIMVYYYYKNPFIFIAFVPSILLWISSKFRPQIVLLENLTKKAHRMRLNDLLIKFERGRTILFYCLTFFLQLWGVITLFVALKYVLIYIFDIIPINKEETILEFISIKNQLNIVILVILYSFSKVLFDITWFFFYLDKRIKREGWDLELECKILKKEICKRDINP